MVNELQLVYCTRALGATAVKKWTGRFWSGRESISNTIGMLKKSIVIDYSR